MSATRIKYVLLALTGFFLVAFFLLSTDTSIRDRRSIGSGLIDNSVIKELLGDVKGISRYQKYFEPEIMFTTLKFMIQEVNEYDPDLVAFVRSMIIKLDRKFPGPVSIESPRKDLAYVDKALHSRRNGFYIEAGAFSATEHSNSLFFEVNRNWSGILIEPLPWYFDGIRKSDRNAYILNACIAKKTPLIAKFRIDSWGSGRESQMPDKRIKEIEHEWDRKWIKPSEKYIFVPCFSLNTIMAALGVKHVDFFSLDVEGSELEVVQSIDYTQLDIDMFSIETLHGPKTKPLIIKHLEDNNYELKRDTNVDIFLVKKR